MDPEEGFLKGPLLVQVSSLASLVKVLGTSAEVQTRGNAEGTQAQGKPARLSRGDALLSMRGVRRTRGFSDERGNRRKSL
jgi:hypothetical protein